MTHGGDRVALRTLVVDDEPHARALVRAMLRGMDDVEVIGEAEDGLTAASLLNKGGVDLVLLDVQMPEMSGFDVIDAVGPHRMPSIVFLTAYDRYAVRAFEVHAVDYILKPYDRPRLASAIARAAEHARYVRGDQSGARLVSMLEQIRARREYPERLVVRGEDRLTLVELREVGWIEANDKVLHIHAGTQVFVTRGSMRALEDQLDPQRFVRVHRSLMVNAAHVRELQPWFQGAYVIVLRDGTRHISGRTYRDTLHALLERYAVPDRAVGRE